MFFFIYIFYTKPEGIQAPDQPKTIVSFSFPLFVALMRLSCFLLYKYEAQTVNLYVNRGTCNAVTHTIHQILTHV